MTVCVRKKKADRCGDSTQTHMGKELPQGMGPAGEEGCRRKAE